MRLLAAGTVAALWPLGAQAAPREIAIQQDTFGALTLLAPAGEPTAFVVYLTDGDLTPERRAEAEQIVARGAAVMPLSTPEIIRRMEAKADPGSQCFYAFGEFEDLSTTAQRALGSSAYRWPVILGNGTASGTLAYLAIAQAPANTGAVSVGFGAGLNSRLPVCPGAKAAVAPGGGFTYAPASDIPAPWVLVAPAEPPAETKAFLDADAGNDLRLEPDPKAQFEAALTAALEMGAPPTASLADLPLVELPAQGRSGTFAVFLSGDGGWRDIDKSIAETLSQNGLSVVGLDSLRYFWKEKRPEQIARDLERIVAHYGQSWQAPGIVLLGYSMGADVIPPAWSKLSQATRDETKLIALMGLEPTAIYQISIAGYLGVNGDDEIDIRPDLKALPASKVMCFYGSDEKADGDTACTLPEMSGAILMERAGGHHLDGDYRAIARDILKRVQDLK
ncbi:MAG: AcvB/VirJ family lysyl-phosphatidylglycerol hydrolase [Geminicoccaceae bacterium]